MISPGLPLILRRAGGGGTAEFLATNREYAFDPHEAAFRTTVASGSDALLSSFRDMQGNLDLSLTNDSQGSMPRLITRRTKAMIEWDGSPATEVLWGNDQASNGWWQYLRDPTRTHSFHLVWEAPSVLPTSEMLVIGSYYWWDLNSRFLYGITGSGSGCRPFFRQRKANGTETTKTATSGSIVAGQRHLLSWVCNAGVWSFGIDGSFTTTTGSDPAAGDVAAAVTSISMGVMREEPTNNVRPLRGYTGYMASYPVAHGSSELASMQSAAVTRYP